MLCSNVPRFSSRRPFMVMLGTGNCIRISGSNVVRTSERRKRRHPFNTFTGSDIIPVSFYSI